MLDLKKEPFKQQFTFNFCCWGLVVFFFNKKAGFYVNWGGLTAVLAHSHSTVQQQLLCLCGAWGRRQEEAKLLGFHPPCSTYAGFLEIVIIPASKLNSWFAERIHLFCFTSSITTLGQSLNLQTLNKAGLLLSPKEHFEAPSSSYSVFELRLCFTPPLLDTPLCLLNCFALK